jgi:hypothetical protein
MQKKNSLVPSFSFDQFTKEPVKAFLLITLAAIGYLYVDSKVQYGELIEKQSAKIEKLELKIDELTSQLKKSDSIAAATTSKLILLQELGKIK